MLISGKKILLFEKYEGVRFVLERSLSKYKRRIEIYSSQRKTDIFNRIKKDPVDLLITELSEVTSDGMEISNFARLMNPDLKIIWITVCGCHKFSEQREKLGDITCIEKPLEIEIFRESVLKALAISN